MEELWLWRKRFLQDLRVEKRVTILKHNREERISSVVLFLFSSLSKMHVLTLPSASPVSRFYLCRFLFILLFSYSFFLLEIKYYRLIFVNNIRKIFFKILLLNKRLVKSKYVRKHTVVGVRNQIRWRRNAFYNVMLYVATFVTDRIPNKRNIILT